MDQTLVLCLALVGAFILVREGASFLNVLYKTLLRPGKNLKKMGSWAVVTGATDGIGKAMAFELARKGLNVLLVGRSAEKLAAVKDECSAQHSQVSIKTEVVDFVSCRLPCVASSPCFGLFSARACCDSSFPRSCLSTQAKFSKADSQRVTDMLSKIEVGVLVNNVGISYPFPQWFHELTDDEVDSIMNVNLQSVVWMTRAVLPQMLDRKRGAVINMSSASARPPNPLLAVYSSTKGFIENFTKSLAVEYKSKGVSFQCQSPLYVATSIVFPGSKVPVEKRATLSTPTAKTYARYAVSRIGHDTMTSPYWVHELYMWVQARLPDDLLGAAILFMHKGVRFHKKNKEKMEEKLGAMKKSN